MTARHAQLLLLAACALALSACGMSNAHVKTGPWTWSSQWKDSELTRTSAMRSPDPTTSVSESRPVVAAAKVDTSASVESVTRVPAKKKKSTKKKYRKRRRRR